MDLELAVAFFLPARSVGLLSTASRALRAALWLRTDSESLWEEFAVRRYGSLVLDVVRRLCPSACGPALYRRARGLRHIFRETVEVVRGGVDKNAEGFEVVACPCLHDPSIAPRGGAQGAVRAAAGKELEEAIAAIRSPLADLSVTLMPGGHLALKVALVVTALPHSLFNMVPSLPSMASGSAHSLVANGIVNWMRELHSNLLQEVRRAGYRSVAMPTLATGGMGMPAHIVAIGAMEAIHLDLLNNPTDPVRIRIACFEAPHLFTVNTVKDQVLDNFYRPEEAFELLKASLVVRSDDSDSDRGWA